MNQLGGFPLLALILFVTGLGALMVWFIPARRADAWRWLAFLIAAATFFISLFLYMGWVNDPDAVLQFVEGPILWLPMLGFRYYLGVDGINLHLVMLTTLLTPLILLRAWAQESKAQMAWMLAFETGMLGALVALDLFLFAAFGSLALLAATCAISCDPGITKQESTPLIRTVVTSPHFLLTGVVIVLLFAVIGGQAFTANAWWAQTGLFGATIVAMGLMSMGFQRQLRRAGIRQPFSPSTYLLINGLLCTLGMYGMVRFCLLAFPLAVTSFAPLMMIVGLVIAAWNALAMLATDDWATTLTCWAVSQVGLDIMGIFSLHQLGIQGVILRLIGRAIGLSVLLIPPSPRTLRLKQAVLAVGFLTALGVPGLAGFPGLSAWLMGLLRWHWQISASTGINAVLDWAFYIATVLVLLIAGGALLRLWHSLPRPDANAPHSRQTWIVLPLLIAIILLGLYPRAFMDSIAPTVHSVMVQFDLDLQDDLGQLVPVSRQQEAEPTPQHGSSLVKAKAPSLLFVSQADPLWPH
ncbi:MAG: hypothetical protein JW934_16915 [Anaerolineae bacterium]|nr:hypothetical protein [Anaerolineae bacterium]